MHSWNNIVVRSSLWTIWMNSMLQGIWLIHNLYTNICFRNSVQEIVEEYNICDEAIHIPK